MVVVMMVVMLVVRQNHFRGTLGQLVQVPLLRQSPPTTSDRGTFQSRIALSACTRIPLLNDPRNIKMSPLQLPTNQRE